MKTFKLGEIEGALPDKVECSLRCSTIQEYECDCGAEDVNGKLNEAAQVDLTFDIEKLAELLYNRAHPRGIEWKVQIGLVRMKYLTDAEAIASAGAELIRVVKK